MQRWRWRKGRKRGPGRPVSDLYLHSKPDIKRFIPEPCLNEQPIELSYPEYNVLELIDLEGLTQVEAANRMRSSRGTVWRLYNSARKKLIKALNEGRPLEIKSKGDIEKV
ncbi:MAG: DUF134 domain-containing protein [Candidatus Korarchaeota archaeon]|nr:DUF134 domain-containing protein [Candidatus Korarchaeota archaeon]NIU84709.1 DUF134 domain-containing protein [Candidatus Thorarchaeota archaeon]NIW14711.1 DUF134 domain-containing protein [Candidatus Thorarchaeota archaeon]NIW52785.1 DUF134 domain-containing protein [Candidatus Korarchaeota archaeon]